MVNLPSQKHRLCAPALRANRLLRAHGFLFLPQLYTRRTQSHFPQAIFATFAGRSVGQDDYLLRNIQEIWIWSLGPSANGPRGSRDVGPDVEAQEKQHEG